MTMHPEAEASAYRIPPRAEHPAATARRRRRRWRVLVIVLLALLAVPLFITRSPAPDAGTPGPEVAEPGPVVPDSENPSLLRMTRDQLLNLVRPLSN